MSARRPPSPDTDVHRVASDADALVLHAQDNVATALRPLAAGQTVRVLGAVDDAGHVVRQDVALCHKFALRDIAEGGTVLKYGEAIGQASRTILAGEHVHIHNLVSRRGRAAA